MEDCKVLRSPLTRSKHIAFVLSINLDGENGYNKTVVHRPKSKIGNWVGNPVMRITGIQMKVNKTAKKILQQIITSDLDLSKKELKQLENLHNKCKNMGSPQNFYATELKQLQKFYKKLDLILD